MSLKKILLSLFLIVITAIILLQIRTIGDFQLDDTYITFSFSKNIADGNGPVYSHGVRVEGYSNFLWMVLLSIPIKIWPHTDIYFLARILMIPFVILLFWSTFQLAQNFTSLFFSLLVLLLLALCTDVFSAAIVGLETIPYTALLTTAFFLYIKDHNDRRTIPIMVLAALMRIDGFIPLAFLCTFELMHLICTSNFSWKKYIQWVAPGLIVYAIWFAWRWWYYGLLFPTTYYAKSHIREALPNRGYEYAWAAFKSCGGMALLPICSFYVFKRPNYKTLWLSLFTLTHVAYVIYVGGDWMPFERFFIPLFPICLTLFILGIQEILKSTDHFSLTLKAPYYTGLASVCVLVMLWLNSYSINTPEERAKVNFVLDRKNNIQNTLMSSAKFFAPVFQPGEKLVHDYTGVFAVFTDAQIIDMWGLCNKDVALYGTTAGINPIYGLTCPACLARENPDFFLTMTLPKPFESFKDHSSVVSNLWQGDQIGRYLDLQNDYVTGKITNTQKNLIGYFLEKRRPEKTFQTRYPAPNIKVEYPFLTEN